MDEEEALKQKLLAGALPRRRASANQDAACVDEESLMKEMLLRSTLIRKRSTPANQDATDSHLPTNQSAAHSHPPANQDAAHSHPPANQSGADSHPPANQDATGDQCPANGDAEMGERFGADWTVSPAMYTPSPEQSPGPRRDSEVQPRCVAMQPI
jgi:hypothetical protein